MWRKWALIEELEVTLMAADSFILSQTPTLKSCTSHQTSGAPLALFTFSTC